MSLATCSNNVKFYKWPSMSLIGVYGTFDDSNMIIKNISWCNQGKQLVAVRYNGSPILITAPKSLEDEIEAKYLQNVDATVATFANISNQTIGIGNGNGDVYLYDVSRKRTTVQYHSLPASVQFLEFSRDDNILAVGCINSYFYLYNSNRQTIMKKPYAMMQVPYSSSVSALIFNKYTSNTLASASKEGVVCVWDVEKIRDTLIGRDHKSIVTDVTFCGDCLLSVGVDGKLVSYDLRQSGSKSVYDMKTPLAGVAYMPNKNEMAVSTCDGQIRAYDLRYMDSPLTTVLAYYNNWVRRITFPIIPEEIVTLYNQKYGDFCTTYSGYSDELDKSSKVSKEVVPLLKATDKDELITVSKVALVDLVKSMEEYTQNSVLKLKEKMQQTFYDMHLKFSTKFDELEERNKKINNLLIKLSQSRSKQSLKISSKNCDGATSG